MSEKKQLYGIIYEVCSIIKNDEEEKVIRKRHRGEFTLNDARAITSIKNYDGIEESLKTKHGCDFVEIVSILPLRKE